MSVIRRLSQVLTFFFVFPVFCSSFAETIKWTGEAGNGLWSDVGNWEGGAVPGNEDSVSFDTTLTITPPVDFAGVICVEANASDAASVVLTCDISESVAFTLGVKRGAKFVKIGNGALTLKAMSGDYYGDIEINAGSVTFAGNGANPDYMAPGGFGAVKIASGVKASIVDSPAATRHGAVILVRDYSADLAIPSDFDTSHGTFADYEKMWNETDRSLENGQQIYVPTEEKPFLMSNVFVPSAFQGKDWYAAYARTLLLMPQKGYIRMQEEVDDRGIVYFDEKVSENITYGNGKNVNLQTVAGFHSLDTMFYDCSSREGLTVRISCSAMGYTGFIASDSIWNGVAFNSLQLAADAKLDIAADTALAIGLKDGSSLSGDVSAAAGSVLALGAGEWTLDAAVLGSFNGTIEVMRCATLDIADLPANAPFSITGNGKVSARAGAVLSSEFPGTIEIPSGTVYTETAPADGKHYYGTGTLRTSTLKGTAEFKGTVELIDGGSATVTDLPNSRSQTPLWRLGDGSVLEFPEESFGERQTSFMDDWNVPNAWMLGGKAGVTNEALTMNPAYIDENGDLVLTDDGGTQRNIAICTNQTFTINSSCDISFKYTPSIEKRYNSNTWAEGFACFFVKKSDSISHGSASVAAPLGSYGFSIYQYRTEGNQGFTWMYDAVTIQGVLSSGRDVSESMSGLRFNESMDITVKLRRGIVTVIFSKNGTVWSGSYDMGNAFVSGLFGSTKFENQARECYFGFSGGTGWWGGLGSVPWCKQTISGFKGVVYGAAGDEIDGYFPATEDGWRFSNEGVELLDGNAGFHFNYAAKVNGFAVSKTALSPFEAFTIEFDENLVSEVGGWAEGFSIFLTPDPASVRNGSGGNNFFPGMSRDVAFGHRYWDNDLCWSTNGSDYALDCIRQSEHGIPKDRGTSRFKLSYNGHGTFVATVARGGVRYECKREYPEMLAWGDKMYLGFMGGAATGWTAYLETKLTNFVMMRENSSAFDIRQTIEVKSNNSGSILLKAPGSVYPITLGKIVLGEDSTLSVDSPYSSVLATPIELVGNATVSCEGSAVLKLSEILLGDGKLTVDGKWTADDQILFKLDPSAIDTRRTIANLPSATFQGAAKPGIKVVNLEGEALPSMYFLRYDDSGDITVLKKYMLMFVR